MLPIQDATTYMLVAEAAQTVLLMLIAYGFAIRK